MPFITHPALRGDADVAIASGNGPRRAPMVEGVIAWPDDVPVPAGYLAAPEPLALREERRRRDIAAVMAEAERLGLTVAAAQSADGAPEEDAPKKARR